MHKIKKMEEKELTYKDFPWGYPLCFNNECAEKERCMHYQAMLLSPGDCHYGPTIFPTAWQDGTCKCFREKRLVQNAWGFKKLYDNVPKWQKAEARACVRSYFSGGCGPYYRVHNGENTISPKQQEEIMKIIAQFGSTEGIKFDHYVTAWNF
jgi:hypothetical protein